MVKRDSCSVKFWEEDRKIFLYEDSIYDEDHEIEGDVYFNHDAREIRIYNFPKNELTSEEKDKILSSILKSTYLFPNCVRSKENNDMDRDIAQYTLLVNGYLLDGTFKEFGKKYKTIIEEFIENTNYFDDSDEIHKIKNKIMYFYQKYKSKLAIEEVEIYLNNPKIIKGFTEYRNFIRLFAGYLKSKGKRFRIIARNKIWDTEKKIVILPY